MKIASWITTIPARLLTIAVAGAFCCLPAFAADDPTMPKAAKDWKIDLIAKAPKLHYPSVVCATPDGRILVGEHPMDQLPGMAAKPIDRVLCIHPDGRITVFAENLYAVFGLAYLDGKVFIHQMPIFSVFKDGGDTGTDRKDLIDTTWPQITKNGGLNDHIPAQIRLAMDGYFYMSVGDKGIYDCVSKVDGSKAENRGGCVMRFRPDCEELEIYANGTRNHLDLALNDEDEIFTYDNTDDGRGWWTRYTHMVDGGFYGYPFDYHPIPDSPAAVEAQIKSGKPGRPYTLWRIEEFGGGSPCGAVGYTEDALPAEYRNNNFHCEWGKRALERFVVERDGGSYKIVKREQVMTAGSIDFNPIGVCITPEGDGFYVADWNQGGWNQPHDQGRLFKLTYTGEMHPKPKPQWFIPASMGKEFKATTAELIEGLKHPAESVRLVAQRRLGERAAESLPMLIELLNDTKAPPYARWCAIWTIDRIEKGTKGRDAILKIAKSDADISVRAQAIRELGTRRAKEATAVCVEALSDSNAQIRFRAATALGRIGDVSAVTPLLSKLDEKDFFTQYSMFNAMHRIGTANPAAWAEVIKGFASDNEFVRQRTTFAMRNAYDEGLVKALSTYIETQANTPKSRAAALAALAPLYKKTKPWDGAWWATQPVGGPPPARDQEWEGTKAAAASIQSALNDANAEVRLAAVEAVQIAPDPGTGKVLAELFAKDKDANVRRTIMKAMAASKSTEGSAFVIEILKNPAANAETLPDAIAVAEQIGTKQSSGAITELISNNADLKPDVMTAAIESIGRLKDAAAVPALTKAIGSKDVKVSVAAIHAVGNIPGDASTAALVSGLSDTRPEVRKASAVGLELAPNRAAIAPLLAVVKEPDVEREAIAALAATPDMKALDAYLVGLSSPDATQREKCRRAITAIARDALPLIEDRLEKSPPSTQVIAELQQVYTAYMPIISWSMVGPFAKDDKEPFPLDNPPIDKELKGLNGPAKWSKWNAESKNGMLDLGKIYGSGDNAAAFGITIVQSTEDRPAEFAMGVDDELTLWLNGEKIFEKLGHGGYNPHELTAKGVLKPGKNTLVAKVSNFSGPWQFSVAMSGEKKGKLFDYDTKKLSPQVFDEFAMKNAGDPARGKTIFDNPKGVACIRCHVVNGTGGDVGPALTGVGVKYDRSKLIESILYPSKQIFDGYQQTIVRTKDSKTFVGRVGAETETELTLVDAEARKTVIKKTNVDRRKVSDVSMMPDGLYLALKPEEFADVVSYLQSLKEPAPAPAKK